MARRGKGYRKKAGSAIGMGLMAILLVPTFYLAIGCWKGGRHCWKHRIPIWTQGIWPVGKFFVFLAGGFLALLLDSFKAFGAWLWGLITDEYPSWGSLQVTRAFFMATRQPLLDWNLDTKTVEAIAVEPTDETTMIPYERGGLLAAA